MNDREHPGQAPLLHAFCHRCERWRVLEAEAFTVDFCVGPDQPGVTRCPDCGEDGLVKVRLPQQSRRDTALLALEQLEHPPTDYGRPRNGRAQRRGPDRRRSRHDSA
jgi:hypothetical protein